MTVNEALAQLTDPIHAEFAAAVADRWNASEREHLARKSQTDSMRGASKAIRSFIKRQIGPHLIDGQWIEFDYDNADSLIRWDITPAVCNPSVSFRIYLGDHMSLAWDFCPSSEADLAARMAVVVGIIKARNGQP